MLQILKKLKLQTKLGPETAHKYSHQNLFEIIYRLSASTKIFFLTETSHWTTALSVKSGSRITLFGNDSSSIKNPYFNNVISRTLKNFKWLKKLSAGSANDNGRHSFELLF